LGESTFGSVVVVGLRVVALTQISKRRERKKEREIERAKENGKRGRGQKREGVGR
jgi:hypothetical protein